MSEGQVLASYAGAAAQSSTVAVDPQRGFASRIATFLGILPPSFERALTAGPIREGLVQALKRQRLEGDDGEHQAIGDSSVDEAIADQGDTSADTSNVHIKALYPEAS